MKDHKILGFDFDNDDELIQNLEKLFEFSSGYFADWFIGNYFKDEKWSISVYVYAEPKEDICRNHRLYRLRASAYNLCQCFKKLKPELPELAQKAIRSFMYREMVKYRIEGNGAMLNLEKYS